MKVSTAVELVGFACLSAAAFVGFFAWRLTAGLVVTGLCLLLIGYGVEDSVAALAVGRIVGPVQHRRMVRKARREARRAERQRVRGRRPSLVGAMATLSGSLATWLNRH